MMSKGVSGFSKWSKSEKISWIADKYFADPKEGVKIIERYWHSDTAVQQLHDEFIENTITNYYLPLGVAPNFLIDGQMLTIPMAIEESSVVAAASKAAKFWLERGGFHTEILKTTKSGQVHFTYSGEKQELQSYFDTIKPLLKSSIADITASMEKRGGGLLSIELVDKTDQLAHYYQIHATFETVDAMGANFINSCLEKLASVFKENWSIHNKSYALEHPIDIVMSILSNYVPDCLVRASVSCPVAELTVKGMSAEEFADKFCRAVRIAEVEPYRAVTHNKGIMNGVDAVVLATGNDFRAVEAGVHAYASRSGQYSSLTHAKVENGQFTFWMDIPLALGTVGGLTQLHPLVRLALEMLQNPNARQLMSITAVAGLAQNFGAIGSLVTTGIQQGHMKMHLLNIANQFGANEHEKRQLVDHFKTDTVTPNTVHTVLQSLRNTNQ